MADGGSVMVIGLGRFGGAAARQLIDLGHEVVGVDANPERVAEYTHDLTKVRESSCATPHSLEQLGATEVEAVLVAIGNDVEASVLITLMLVELGVQRIWAKATSESHKRILEKVGAHQVVLPEVEVGRAVAHRLADRVVDYFTIEAPAQDTPGFVIAEALAPAALAGQTLATADVRAKSGVTILCVKQPGESWELGRPDTEIRPDALVLVAGEPGRVDRFWRGG